MIRIIIILFIFSSTINCATSKVQNEFVLFDNKQQATIVFSDDLFEDEAKYLGLHLENVSGKRLNISRQIDSNSFCLVLKRQSEPSKNFAIYVLEKQLIFEATNPESMRNALNSFFIHSLKYIPYQFKKSELKLNKCTIPANFNLENTKIFFSYREPYFIENNHADFRGIHQTTILDDVWAIWGHNLPKKIKISHDMIAEVNGQKNENQLCFSSEALKSELIKFIVRSRRDNPDATKFMIMPLDNELSCMCTRCKQRGNSQNNATPAVFALINDLATKFADLEFFGTSYLTNTNPPDFKLKENVGVMFTTMAYPKGVVHENTKSGKLLKHQITAWKTKTSKILVWDYVIHFDNYLSTYPTILITQENLKWYHKLGVSGVFLHGSDEMYTAFSDVKAFAYAELLQNPNLDVDVLILNYLENFYPLSAQDIHTFYMRLEKAAFLNHLPLDFYGGWTQDFQKYLNADLLWELIPKLENNYLICSHAEKQNLNPLLAALSYQKLEIMRTRGLREFGFLQQDESSISRKVKSEVISTFVNWKKYRELADFSILNESKLSVSDYEMHWEKLILKNSFVSILFGEKLKANSVLDEDYTDIGMLTDGALGFLDYFNNWLISTSAPLSLEIPLKEKYSGAFTLDIGFLQSTRHRIYLPQSVTLEIGGQRSEHEIDYTHVKDSNTRLHFSIALTLNGQDSIKLLINKQKQFANLATACDEIKLYPNFEFD